MLVEAGDCHLLIIQGVSEIHDTILEACFMHITDGISWPLDASFVSRGEFRFGRTGVEEEPTENSLI